MNNLNLPIFRDLIIFLACLSWAAHCMAASHDIDSAAGELKPRIVVLTDIAPGDREPDDMESVVRLLSHADLLEIEALITCSGWNNSGGKYSEDWASYLHTVIDAYEKDLPNLMKRSAQNGFLSIDEESAQQPIGYWPSADYLRSRHYMGCRDLGVAHLGHDNASAGSDAIIDLALDGDERPLWILAWGGGNTVAQALWQLKEAGDADKLNRVLGKLRIYAITDQDVDWGRRGQYDISSHKWMRRTFGDRLFFIWDESAWLSQCGIGASNWSEYESKIQSKGNLGSVYPHYKYGVEGDTPSFLYVMPNGLNDPQHPEYGGWGGYFQYVLSPDSVTRCYVNMRDDIKQVSQKYENRFYPAIFNNFAARMEWAQSGHGNRNPELAINGYRGHAPLVLNVSPGQRVVLDTHGSHDPDGDNLSYKWWIMSEAGASLPDSCMTTTEPGRAVVHMPEDFGTGEIHVICECTDDGAPSLTTYRRIILKVE